MYFKGRINADILLGICGDYFCAKENWEELASTKVKPIWMPSLPADEMDVYREYEKQGARLEAVCDALELTMDSAVAAYREYDAGGWSYEAEKAAVKKYFGKKCEED